MSEQEKTDYEKKVEMEIKLEKANAQMRIAVIALFALIGIQGLFMTGYVPVERIEAISSPTSTFYIATASIVGAYMGFTAWMSRK